MLFRDHGLGTTIWSPLASGLLSGKYNHATPKDTRLEIEGLEWLKERTLGDTSRIEKTIQLSKLSADLGTTLNKLALAWTVKNPNVSTCILGASKVEQLTDNLKSLEVLPLLTNEVMEKIETILVNKPVQALY